MLAYGLVSGVVTTVPVGRLLELAANTGALSAAVTFTSSLIGGASAWLVSRTDLPGKRLATVLVIIPFAVPSFVGALALLGATGADGVLSAVSTWMGGDIIRYPSGFWAAWLVLTLISVPLVHLAIAPAMGSLNPTLEEAARGLGRRADEGVLDDHPAPTPARPDRRSSAGGPIHPSLTSAPSPCFAMKPSPGLSTWNTRDA